mmetsp:Transcript_22130/g.25318  ORF Transcript_22130/g.25318 Transcript_22130/m.25318 type:complete len:105 (-) Transcript_22130:1529-1843(-)
MQQAQKKNWNQYPHPPQYSLYYTYYLWSSSTAMATPASTAMATPASAAASSSKASATTVKTARKCAAAPAPISRGTDKREATARTAREPCVLSIVLSIMAASLG